MSFLKINNLSVNYRMRKEIIYAVKNINIDVKKGEILGLVGESGSGKSTLGNAIINLIDEPGKISGGKVILDGVSIHDNLRDILRPILVIGTIGLALAIIAESTLSFLGVGVPPTTPSLGTLIRIGNDFLFSGEWWITFFPAIFLVILAFSINLLGDWMRDTLNPKLN